MKIIHIIIAGLAVYLLSMTGSMAQNAVARANESVVAETSPPPSNTSSNEEISKNGKTKREIRRELNKKRKNIDAKSIESESNEDLSRVLFTTP
jgi:hypothetical protein